MTTKTIYRLTADDVQTVAQDEIGRALTKLEIQQIRDVIAEKINWFEVIAAAINETILSTENQETA